MRQGFSIWLALVIISHELFAAVPGDPPPSRQAISESDAVQLVSRAAVVRDTLPCYKLVSHAERGKNLIQTTIWTKNRPDGATLIVSDRVSSSAHAQGKHQRFIFNTEGTWERRGNEVVRIPFAPDPRTRIPLRFTTAQTLGLPGAVTAELEGEVDYFGRAASRLTLKLTAEGEAALNAARTRASSDSARPVSRGAIVQPSSYIYYIDKATNFILCWQALLSDGNVQAEIAYQEFDPSLSLPDSFFAAVKLRAETNE